MKISKTAISGVLLALIGASIPAAQTAYRRTGTKAPPHASKLLVAAATPQDMTAALDIPGTRLVSSSLAGSRLKWRSC